MYDKIILCFQKNGCNANAAQILHIQTIEAVLYMKGPKRKRKYFESLLRDYNGRENQQVEVLKRVGRKSS